MTSLLIKIVADSIESGILKNFIIKVMRNLAGKTTNQIDDQLVDIIEAILQRGDVDSAINNYAKSKLKDVETTIDNVVKTDIK